MTHGESATSRGEDTPWVEEAEWVDVTDDLAGQGYRAFWTDVGREFPSLKGAASTDYYFEGVRRLFERFFPPLAGRSLLKTDLWDEAKGTEILLWAAGRGARPFGVDIAPATIRAARATLDGHGPGFVQSDVRAIALRDASVDLVYSMGTIEHFAEYATAVAEIHRVLKPGGRAIIGVPNKLDPFLRPLLVQALYSVGAYAYGLEKSFTPRELRRVCESAGFRCEALSGVLFMPGWLRMLDLVLHNRGSRLASVTRASVRPFAALARRFPSLNRHGYLIAWIVEKPGPVSRPLPPRLRRASVRDVVGIAQMGAGVALTAVAGSRALPRLARAIGAVYGALGRGEARHGADLMRRRLGATIGTDEAHALFAEHRRRKYEHLLGRARDTLRCGWQPGVELRGLEHLDAALAAGRGAILWTMSFCGPLLPKLALARAGVRITHLSMSFHGGFSPSWAAVRILNPWTRRAEDKHLAERVVIPLDRGLGYVRRLRAVLLGNGVLSIAGEHRGPRNVRLPFLGEETEFATGAWSLARATGAALLTVSANRPRPGAYEVAIGAPVAIPPGRAGSAELVIGELVRRLEHAVRAHPADWERWSTIDPAEKPFA